MAAKHHTKTMVLIGSTGFLGPYILASLLKKNFQSQIFCINRSIDGEERTITALRKLAAGASLDLSRLHFLVTDITQPQLGLESSQAALLSLEASELVFNAWNPNWGLPFENFKPLLRALSSAIAFCIFGTHQMRLTFISSICAIGEWPRQHPECPIIPEIVPPGHSNAMLHGYGESKCWAERLLKEASDTSSLRVAIVRSGQIGGPSKAQGGWPVQGWLKFFIEGSKSVGYWPRHVQPVDWIPVDALAESIATLTSTEPPELLRVYNVVHPNPASWDLFYTLLRDKFGLQAEEVTLPEWLNMFRPEKMKLHRFLSAAGNGREFDMQFETANAEHVLSDPVIISLELLERWMGGWNLKLGDERARL
jgi:thioester reductase-like protein